MQGNKKKSLDWDITSLVVKIAVLVVTIGVGLWMGQTSYDAFYIAAFIQAINNMYDGYSFFHGYTRWITAFHVISFMGSLGCVLLFFAHLTQTGAVITDTHGCMYFVSAMLSMPVLYLLIELYKMIRDERY